MITAMNDERGCEERRRLGAGTCSIVASIEDRHQDGQNEVDTWWTYLLLKLVGTDLDKHQVSHSSESLQCLRSSLSIDCSILHRITDPDSVDRQSSALWNEQIEADLSGLVSGVVRFGEQVALSIALNLVVELYPIMLEPQVLVEVWQILDCVRRDSHEPLEICLSLTRR